MLSCPFSFYLFIRHVCKNVLCCLKKQQSLLLLWCDVLVISTHYTIRHCHINFPSSFHTYISVLSVVKLFLKKVFSKHQNKAEFKNLDDSEVLSSDFQTLEPLQPKCPLQPQQPPWPQWPLQPHFIKNYFIFKTSK